MQSVNILSIGPPVTVTGGPIERKFFSSKEEMEHRLTLQTQLRHGVKRICQTLYLTTADQRTLLISIALRTSEIIRNDAFPHKEIIWNNRNIMIDGKPLFDNCWFENNITRAEDLIDDNGNVL